MVRLTGRYRPGRWSRFAFGVVVVVSLIVVSPSLRGPSAGASSVPRCTAGQLQISVVPDGPRNSHGAVFLSDVASQDCSLAGQPALRVFDQSGRELNRSESLYRWTPPLPRPISPIVMTGTATKSSGVSAVVEFDWCGFGDGNKRFEIGFAGSKKPFVVRTVAEAPATAFVSPACSNGSTTQLTVDYVRELGSEGIVGLSHSVRVSPSTSLHNGEKVRVSVSGFWPGGKFWLAECSTAEYQRNLRKPVPSRRHLGRWPDRVRAPGVCSPLTSVPARSRAGTEVLLRTRREQSRKLRRRFRQTFPHHGHRRPPSPERARPGR
jgi:hypothetical protein